MNALAAIEVHQLGKEYQLGEQRGSGYNRITERFADAVRPNRRRAVTETTLWALRGIDVMIGQGETVGIVGRNGAGKSTLLKLLSRVTAPTEGRIVLRGRVGSLLEVGTGFHPELTGRENVMLNGAILGMRQREVSARLDEIVDFADIERFMNTPVKRYSSGMYMRLAFAVAAHLDTEILLVDEVLAVGDMNFRRKSVGKMREAANDGRTVVFVSHNMSAISSLCERCLYLLDGSLVADGATGEVLNKYLREGVEGTGSIELTMPDSKAAFLSIRSLGSDGDEQREYGSDDPIRLELVLRVREPVPGLYLTMILRSDEGVAVLMTEDRDVDDLREYGQGDHELGVQIPAGLLAPGRYFVTVGAASGLEGRFDHRDGVLDFSVHDYDRPRGNSRIGVLGVTLPWDHELRAGGTG